MSDVRADERRRHTEAILRASIAAADPAAAVRAALAHGHVAHPRLMLAIGKAAGTMAHAALDVLPHPPARSLVVVPHGTSVASRNGMRVLHAAHPVPDAASVDAGRAVAELLSAASGADTVLALISGGASSLAILPIEPITVGDYAATVQLLLNAGADIVALNTVRSHIDVLKGGGMGRLTAPARVLGLIVSDVVGDRVDVIASGPLTPPASSPADALRVLGELDLAERIPGSVSAALNRDVIGTYDHAHVDARVILDNRVALEGAAREARRLGYEAVIDPEPVTGAARDAGKRIAADALRRARAPDTAAQALCIVRGGETTVRVSGAGSGGRNQELVLAAALALRGTAGITIGSIGTDGTDGPTDAAGAIADGGTASRGAHAGCDIAVALERNDSHSFFVREGGVIRTGQTGTNVMDVQIALIDARR